MTTPSSDPTRPVPNVAEGTRSRGQLTGLSAAAFPSQPAPDLVRRENAKPGTRDWMLANTRIDAATKYRCPWIEGYCSRTSVRAGEEIAFYVSTNPASPFRLEIYRSGFYGGSGGRRVLSLGPFNGTVQPEPPVGERRLRDCCWEPSATITIPGDWLSGVYVGKLIAQRDALESYLIFIVRDDRRADFLFQCSDTTWQAYNRWPQQFSLYDDGRNEWYWGGESQVSFNRPYGKYCQFVDSALSIGSGEWFLWEFPFAYWLEEHGYDVTYVSSIDTHADPNGLLRVKGFLSVGHDEYYSSEMFDHLKSAIDAGLSLGFFSANTCCGRILFAPDTRNGACRIFRRVGVFGPPGGIRDLVGMDTLPHERPYANELVGAQSTGPLIGGADWTCREPRHWIFEGTGMKQGDAIPGLVGWEWNGDPARIPGLVIVASGSTRIDRRRLNGGIYTATVYSGPKRNFVFNAATCWWADGLSAPPGYVRPTAFASPQGPDPRAQRITANVLERMCFAIVAP
jgi:hypothetical protein